MASTDSGRGLPALSSSDPVRTRSQHPTARLDAPVAAQERAIGNTRAGPLGRRPAIRQRPLTRPPAAFYCVADERYFLGAVGLVNSLRLVGHRSPSICSTAGSAEAQRELLAAR